MDGAPRILVVEDTDEVRGVLTEALTRQGYVVAAARDVASGRAAMAAQAFDLVLLDAMLPGEPWIALAAEARERGIPVTLMSGHPAVLGNPPEGYGLLAKPFRLAQFLAHVENLLDPVAPGSR